MKFTKANKVFLLVMTMILCAAAFYWRASNTNLSKVNMLEELNLANSTCQSLTLNLSLNRSNISKTTEKLEKHINATDKIGLSDLTKNSEKEFKQLVYRWKSELLPQFRKLSNETSSQLNASARNGLINELNSICIELDKLSKLLNYSVISNLAANRYPFFFLVFILLLFAYFVFSYHQNLYLDNLSEKGIKNYDGKNAHAINSNKVKNKNVLTEGNKTNIQQYISSLDIAHKAFIQLVKEPESTEPFTLFLDEIEKLTGATSSAIYITSNSGPQSTLLASTDLNDQDWADAIPARILPKITSFDKVNKIMEIYEKTVQPKHKFICVQLHQGLQDFSLMVLKLPFSKKLTDSVNLTLLEYSDRLANTVSGVLLVRLKLRHAQHNERAVIARELHDSLAQSLSYLKIQASRLQGILTSSDIQACNKSMEIDAMMQDLRSNLNIAYRHLRELISTFRLTMDGKNFSQALTDSVEELARRSSIAFDIDNRLPIDILSVTEETQLLHIIRESLSNVVKHSRAKLAIVSIHYNNHGQITTMIEDDGVGIPDISNPEQHFGVIIMQERAHSINGSISLTERAGGGACLKVTFMASKYIDAPSNV